MLRSGIVLRLLFSTLLLFSVAHPAGSAVVNVRARPSSFSPDGDGIKESTLISWDIVGSPAECLWLTITGAGTGGVRVRTINLGARPVGPDSLEWDGRDSLGTVQPERFYSIELKQKASCDDTDNVSLGLVSVFLDLTVPPIPLFDHGDTLVTKPLFQLTGFASDADTVALFRGGVPVDTNAVIVAAGSPNRFSFDLTLTEGDNLLSVQGWDRAGHVSVQTLDHLVIYQNTPDIGPTSASPTFFSPNGDGVQDSTRFRFNLDAPSPHLVIQVRRGTTPPNQTGIDPTQIVAYLYDGPAAAGPQVFTWDGRDSSGTITTDGDYVFRATSDSVTQQGAAIPGSKRSYAKFVLDNTPPPLPLVEPLPARTIRTEARVVMSLVFTDSLRIFRDGLLIETRQITPQQIKPTTYTQLVPLHLGPNLLAFQAVDLAGNASPVAGPFTITYETPVGFHAPERFRRDDAFGVNVSAPASAVVVDVFTLRGKPVRQLTATGSASHFELQWDLKDQAGALVGDGPYLARVRVSYPDGNVIETKAAIVVVK
jgi:flagellar hook assembly protein FlgD